MAVSLQDIVQAASTNPWTKVRPENGDYQENGVWYCGLCHTPKQVRPRNDREGLLFGDPPPMCLCACMKQKRDAEATKERQREAKRAADEARREGFADIGRQHQTFAEAEDTEVIRTAKRYVENWAQNRTKGGLYLYGPTGSGKTFAASCIANAVIDAGSTALVTSLPRLIDKMLTGDAAQVLSRVATVSLLVLDDFGTERHTETATEKVFQLIDARVSSGKPMIVTSNRSLSEVCQEGDIAARRIASRLRGACVPIFVGGKDRRSASAPKI